MKPSYIDKSKIQDDDADVVSKTQRKAEMDALQVLGMALTELPKDRLAKLNLPETLLEAVKEAKRITANGAIRRQRQYIGSLMRNSDVDVAAISEQLDKWAGKNNEENAKFHLIERWRERLISDDAAFVEYHALHPQIDVQQIRTLIRNARREAAENKPPKSSRALFQVLREMSEQTNPEKSEPTT